MSELALTTVDYATRARIITMLVSGEYPTDMEIAVACNVTPAFIQRVLAEDQELSEARRQAEIEMAQKIERSAMQMAIDSRNPIAKQKAQEFMLKKLMPDKYGDNASNISVGKSKKINISLTMPEVAVDENGIPVAQSVSPLQGVIESK
jgi:hypothetical protein